MENDHVSTPPPLGPRDQQGECRELAEALNLLATAVSRLDKHRDALIPGESQDDFHVLAKDLVLHLALLNRSLSSPDSAPEPALFDYKKLQEHGLTGKIGAVKRNVLRRAIEEVLAAFGAGAEEGTWQRRAVAAAVTMFDAGAFILDSADAKLLSEACSTGKVICEAAVRRFDVLAKKTKSFLRFQ